MIWKMGRAFLVFLFFYIGIPIVIFFFVRSQEATTLIYQAYFYSITTILLCYVSIDSFKRLRRYHKQDPRIKAFIEKSVSYTPFSQSMGETVFQLIIYGRFIGSVIILIVILPQWYHALIRLFLFLRH